MSLGLEPLEERNMWSIKCGGHWTCKRRLSSSGLTPVAITVQSRPDRKCDVLHFREFYFCMEKRDVRTCLQVRVYLWTRQPSGCVFAFVHLSWLGMWRWRKRLSVCKGEGTGSFGRKRKYFLHLCLACWMDKPCQTGTAATAGRCCLAGLAASLRSEGAVLPSVEWMGCLAG